MTMTRIQFDANPERLEVLANLQADIGAATRTDLINAAISMLAWAVRQKKQGRYIFTGNANGERLVELSTPHLETVKVDLGFASERRPNERTDATKKNRSKSKSADVQTAAG